MRLTAIVTKCFLVCFLFLASHSYAAEEAKQPFLLVEDPWPPYTVGEAAAAPTSGLIVELMEELFQRIDHPVTLMLHPWKRCIYMVKNNQADALMLTVHTVERERFACFREPFFENKILFYHRNELEFSWNSFADLKGLTIGVVDGAKYSQEFQDAVQQYQLQTEVVSSIELNLNKLMAGRIDITPVLDVVAARMIADNQSYAGIVASIEKPLRTTPMQMAISRRSDLMDYKKQINQAIKDMKADGTVDRLYKKYVPEQPKAPSLQAPGAFKFDHS